jgi:choline dehydrogenase-like flavoprotein
MSYDYGHVEVPSYPVPDPAAVIGPEAPADGWEQARGGRRIDCDVCIVGSGPGGASAARVLARAGLKVVVLEEGPARQNFRPNQQHTARYHMQEGGVMIARGRIGFPIAAGRGVGGGTLINSALSFRTPTTVLNHWVDLLKDPRWSPASLAEVYAEVERIAGVGITPVEVAGRNNQIVVDGVRKLGLPGGLAPRSTPGCKGCGICNWGCPTRGKASTNLTFLPDAVSHGALIQADTKVFDVRTEGGKVVGVVGRVLHPDTGEELGLVEVNAARVILSAGAIGTPRLLWHAGLAERMGAGVGTGLHVHAGSAVLGLHDDPVHLWTGATQGAYFSHPDLPGVLPHTFTAPPEACLATLGKIGPTLAEGLEMLPRLSGLIVLVSDESTGTVRAWGDGRADVVYDVLDVDLQRTIVGLVESSKVLFAGGAKQVTAPIHGVGFHSTPESFHAALKTRKVSDLTMYAAHPMSSCRMGLDPATHPIGPDGQSHHVKGLFISDASIYPTSLGVNPQLTTMAAGTLIARGMVGAA